jgi:hypothetical protein
MQFLNLSASVIEPSASSIDKLASWPVNFPHNPVFQRIQTVDIVRGFALLGILLMNVVGFGPLEWLWRSLTYWKRQPERLSTDWVS